MGNHYYFLFLSSRSGRNARYKAPGKTIMADNHVLGTISVFMKASKYVAKTNPKISLNQDILVFMTINLAVKIYINKLAVLIIN
jgi:hypothetical protein